ncbi:MAG: hypothetical protein WAN03_01620 [Candidatus Sulfotelmatobacter sp.]
MMHSMLNKSVLKSALLMALALVSAHAWAEQKKTESKPAAPAHNAAPAQHAAAPTQHSNTQTHTTTPSNNNHNSTMGNHTNSTMGNHTNSTTGNHTNSNMGNHTNSNMGNHANTPGAHGAGGHNGPNNNMAHGNAHTPAGVHEKTLRGGGTASIRRDGSVRSVNRNGMQIQRGFHGGRTVVSTRNGARVVTVGRGGYVQRAYVVRGGRSYYSRTYYYHGAYRVGVYRGYYYGGRPYYGYYPSYYYGPAYYGWAYNPWPAPVYYGWGWGGAPWYGYYGPYYAPYPVYPSAAFWITDYMISASLQAAYAANAAANANLLPLTPDGTLVASLLPLAAEPAKAALSKEVKDQLAEEVKLTIAAEQAEASKPKSASSGGGQPATSNEAPPALDPKFKLFVVSSDMSLVADGEECPLSQGDIISRTTETPDGDGNVNVKVVASTKGDCAIGKEGPVSTDDLQEMYNQFRDQLKDGMGELAKKNGSGGLPKSPDTATTDGDVPAPPPDKSVEKTLAEQQTAADQAETDAKQEAGSGGGGAQ